MRIIRIIISFTLLLFIVTNLTAQAPDTIVQKIDENTYTLDQIEIDLAKQEITFPAEVNMDRGLIETIIVGPKGKLHETIFKTQVMPSYIQTSLLLLGLECGQNMEPGDFRIKPKGDSIAVYAMWTDSLGVLHKERAENLVWNTPKNRQMLETPWVFLGSKIINGQFVADIEQNIMRTYHDPFAILHNPLTTNLDDTFYEVNQNTVPPPGTNVNIVVKSLN